MQTYMYYFFQIMHDSMTKPTLCKRNFSPFVFKFKKFQPISSISLHNLLKNKEYKRNKYYGEYSIY